ncbi:MAG TPA: PadR family transcriptional regulator [Ktedonobacteraceae bacterium]|nr:PadR family transcriptional regulator [Ktedonobacteraceae bacterium]HEV2660884.1 PadR family transcriptional regulator [Ktedonobacteraceae bacterium]
MYELLVLSLLIHWPLHAYRIAKIANEIIGPEDQISTGTLSTLLGRLVQAGLIAPADAEATPFPTDRPSHVFAITPAGRERFIELMLDTTSHPGTYRRLFHIKALHLEFLPLESQLFLVEHYLVHCRQLLGSKQADRQDVAAHPIKQERMSSALREAAFALMQLKEKQWQLELTWAQSLREQIVSRLKQHEAGTS